MRILVYSLNYAPELTGIGKYTAEMVEWLADQGHTVRVVTALPYYPQWRVHDDYGRRRYMRDELGGLRVWRTPLYVPAAPNGVRRVLHLASFAVLSFRY